MSLSETQANNIMLWAETNNVTFINFMQAFEVNEPLEAQKKQSLKFLSTFKNLESLFGIQ